MPWLKCVSNASYAHACWYYLDLHKKLISISNSHESQLTKHMLLRSKEGRGLTQSNGASFFAHGQLEGCDLREEISSLHYRRFYEPSGANTIFRNERKIKSLFPSPRAPREVSRSPRLACRLRNIGIRSQGTCHHSYCLHSTHAYEVP